MHASHDTQDGKATETTAMRELFEKLEAAEKGRQHAEKALKRLERAVDTMHIGVTITDLDGTILYTNPADAAMHGYAVEELIGENVGLLAAPEQQSRLSAEQVLRVRVWEREAVDVQKDGTRFPVLLISDIVEGPDGPVAIVTTCGNLTKRRRAEQQLIDDALHDPAAGVTGDYFLLPILTIASNSLFFTGCTERRSCFTSTISSNDLVLLISSNDTNRSNASRNSTSTINQRGLSLGDFSS